MTLQMPVPAPLAAAASLGQGEAAVTAMLPGPLSTRKAKSLDVHVPSLRRTPTGACSWLTQLGRGLLTKDWRPTGPDD